MMDIETTCPFGSKCEEIKDNKMHRCAWYTEVEGKNPQSEEIINEWRCAIAWMPMLLIENAQTNRGTGAAVESFRNEMVKAQGQVMEIALSDRKKLT